MADMNEAEGPGEDRVVDLWPRLVLNNGDGHLEEPVVAVEGVEPPYNPIGHEMALFTLRITWHFIEKDYGPDWQFDNVDCQNRMVDWHGQAVLFQRVWGERNMPRDIVSHMMLIRRGFLQNVRPVTPETNSLVPEYR